VVKQKCAGNVEITFISIPYPGGAPAISALRANTSGWQVAGQLSSAKLRVLAATTKALIKPLARSAEHRGVRIQRLSARLRASVVAAAKTLKETTFQLARYFTAAV
jgi:hypothetical protein